MIELRWVERTGLRSDEAGEEWEQVERVLQYRQRNEDMMGFIAQPWSDWIDVPTVREDG